MSEIFKVTVSQVNRRLSLLVKSDKELADLYVCGEISNFTNHYASGHFYFTLKDDDSSIKCVMFRSYSSKVGFTIENGMKVIVHCSVNVYEKDGANQLYVTELFEDGIGDEYLSFVAAKNQLEKEGYFSQKRKLPFFPKKICIITSEKAAALQDMLNILSRRCPVVSVVLIDSAVQGASAPEALRKAVLKAQDTDCDLIIIGRGGGSAEDLSAFNDIELAKALFASKIPTISAVGHETDFSITDFVADMRAPTPSAAAELAVPDISDMLSGACDKLQMMEKLVAGKITACENSLMTVEAKIAMLSPRSRLEIFADKLDSLSSGIRSSFYWIICDNEHKLIQLAEHISDINPMKILLRGYSITQKNDKNIMSVKQLAEGDNVEILFADGLASAHIDTINVKEPEHEL